MNKIVNYGYILLTYSNVYFQNKVVLRYQSPDRLYWSKMVYKIIEKTDRRHSFLVSYLHGLTDAVL